VTRVALDVQATQTAGSGARGIGRYVTDHVRALLAADAPVAALVHRADRPAPTALVDGTGRADLLVGHDLPSWRGLVADGPVAWHVTSPFERDRPPDAVLPPHALAGASHVVTTLYDCIPFAWPEAYQPGGSASRTLHARARLVRAADLVLAISAHTRAEGIRLLGLDPDRVVEIGGAAGAPFRPAAAGDHPATAVAVARPAIDRPYVLTVVSWEPRKNVLALVDGYARLSPFVRAGHRLVVAGRLPAVAGPILAARAAAAGLAPGDVVTTGPVDDALLVALYQAAACTVVPSLAEGFGLPVLEAARCGSPTVTAATTATPEVLDLAESTFDPVDPDAIAARIEAVLTDPAVRQRNLAAGAAASARHTWEAVADRTTAAYARLGIGAEGPRAPTCLRVAVVGDPPGWADGPTPGPASDGAAHPATVLARAVELTWCTADRRFTGAPRPFRLLPEGTLGSLVDPHGFDVVVATAARASAVERFRGTAPVRLLADGEAPADVVARLVR
jgi:glycosyltransferase involved in cell wall biosynthesis